ncbi:MAG: aminoacyl-tRNA hydrolase, partial [Pseudonocardia sp.]|nr:aminoacyl-tRNA hydrolase [Pseudonocardia sp.]
MIVAPGPALVVGLGNPGPDYAGTRHNVGFRVVELLAARAGGGRFSKHRSNSDVLEGRLAGRRVVLAKPRTYMNVSGAPVANLAKYFSVPLDDVVVVHDDLDLGFGVIRLKRGGGEGGHNGLRSITSAVGTREYLR